ncbi:MAG: LysR family transcriptional regulator, partial [Defluviitaleaceae bacterium]|nr:LysR family transcriptional regulator [Defluviitaleaceae bacterium]
MDINMELYKIFREVAKSGNISKAAEVLFVSQPAVSQAIKQLEDKTGVRLFDRVARGVRLTAEGEVLFSYVNSAVTLIENGQEKLGRMRELRAGEIKIGASDTICRLFLLPMLKKFNAEHPDIRISVTNRVTRESLALLKGGAVDLAFINLPAEEDGQVEITPVMPIHDCFVAGEKYAFLADSVMNLADLREYPVLMLERASNSRQRMDAFLSGHGAEIRPAIELGAQSLLADFAKIGLGIAATIREDAAEMLAKGELFELRFTEELPERHIGLARM